MVGSRGSLRGGGYRAGGRGKGGQGGKHDRSYPEFDGLEEAESLEDGDDGDDFNSSDEDVHDELVLPIALPVMGGPLPPSDEPPKDADEYLRRVQWERMHLSETVDAPDVVEKPSRRRKQNDKVSLLTQFDAPEVPEERRHCTVWAEDVLAAFRDLRGKCMEAREACADEEDGNSLSASTWRENECQHRPSTSALAALDLVTLHDLLAAVIDGIVEGQESFCSCAGSNDADMQSADTSDTVSGPFGSGHFLAEWAFAVLAFVEEPLVDDIQFNLQRLRRACQKCVVNAHKLADAGVREYDSVAHTQATLLLVIVTEHFGQR